jgi:methylenetetrahydrofolate dehydrogenase (NAD+)
MDKDNATHISVVLPASEIARRYEDEIEKELSAVTQRMPSNSDDGSFVRLPLPQLVGVLATQDPWAEQYAVWTERACTRVGILFKLARTTPEDLSNTLNILNQDSTVHGIMVYYPIENPEQDRKIQESIPPEKDVEGLCSIFNYNLYHNIRYLDNDYGKKCLLPCTALAVVKVLEYLNVYNPLLLSPYKLRGRVIGVINRSETVGKPLAAMLANDGAKVFSIDRDNIDLYYRDPYLLDDKGETFLKVTRFSDSSCLESLALVLPLCDVIITGVPVETYKVPIHLLKEGVVAINFSSTNNFPSEIQKKASLYVSSVGKVTVAMLLRNLLRLYCNKYSDLLSDS